MEELAVSMSVTQSCLTLCDLMVGTHQAPPSMGLSRQEYWGGLSFPSPGHLPNPGIESGSPTLPGRFFTIWVTREDCDKTPRNGWLVDIIITIFLIKSNPKVYCSSFFWVKIWTIMLAEMLESSSHIALCDPGLENIKFNWNLNSRLSYKKRDFQSYDSVWDQLSRNDIKSIRTEHSSLKMKLWKLNNLRQILRRLIHQNGYWGQSRPVSKMEG